MSSCSPDAQISILAGHAQVNSRALHCGPQPGQSLRFEWDSPFKDERHFDLGGSDERKRNAWRIVLFSSQTCPEGHIDNGLDGFDIREKFDCPLALNPPLGEMLAVMRVDPQRRSAAARAAGYAGCLTPQPSIAHGTGDPVELPFLVQCLTPPAAPFRAGPPARKGGTISASRPRRFRLQGSIGRVSASVVRRRGMAMLPDGVVEFKRDDKEEPWHLIRVTW